MKIYIIGILTLLLYKSVPAQTYKKLAFQPLRIIDTVYQKTINKIQSRDRIKNSSFFFTENYNHEHGLFLFEKRDKNWIVYDYNDVVTNYQVKPHETYSRRYVSKRVSAMRSGMGENYYGWCVLFDLQKKSYVVLNTFSHNSGQYSDSSHFYNECDSKIEFFKNGILKITETCNVRKEDKNYCEGCIKSGIYKVF